MSLSITAFYAGLLALMLIVLSARVIQLRKSTRTLLGEGADKALLVRIRTHANFVEFVPLCLILLALCEVQGAPAWALHLLGLMLFGGRISHAMGMSDNVARLPFRQAGMILTFTMLLVSGIGLIAAGLL